MHARRTAQKLFPTYPNWEDLPWDQTQFATVVFLWHLIASGFSRRFCPSWLLNPLGGGLMIKILTSNMISLFTMGFFFFSFACNILYISETAKTWILSVHLWTSWLRFVRLPKGRTSSIMWTLWLIQKPNKCNSKTGKPLFASEPFCLAGISVEEAHPG